MKKQHSHYGVLRTNRNILLGISFCIILAFTAMAFQDSSKIIKQDQARLDTVPKINDFDFNINLKDLDENIKKSMEQVEKSMKNIDWGKMSKQIEQSMKEVDMVKLQLQMEKSMKAVDWKKMQLEIERSMKDIDPDSYRDKIKMDFNKLQIEKEIKDAMKNINMDELKKSMEELKKINFDDVKKQMEQVKKEMALNKDHFKLDMEKLKSEMEKAKVDMQKVKEEMGEVKEMVGELEKDGLLNKNESNSIEYKNKELFINGKKQSTETTEKYKKYFKGDNIKFNFNWN